jgi:peptidoglycan/xylan/chitin deacetylase (PgdA/CDA1 family)
MAGQLTIVMYHYVHEAGGAGFARLIGRSFDEFQGQLDHLQQRYTIISPDSFFAAVKGERILPANACMLTFDDGYRIHYSVVFKALRERGLSGCFFPPACPVLEPRVLDVHKIHFALASSAAPGDMCGELRAWIDARADGRSLRSSAEYWSDYGRPSRFDPAEIVFVKRTLQKGLPEEARAEAVDWLFRRYAGRDEAALSEKFYLRWHELVEMVRDGMYVGCHGFSHRWLDTLSQAAQDDELDLSLSFLEGIGAPTRDWTMCYPYGGYNAPLLDLLRRRGCIAGVTTRVAVAHLGKDDSLELPRLDTNDLPLCADAAAGAQREAQRSAG